MGLDIYAGPLTRYVAGDWLTVVQQAGMRDGFEVRIVRPEGTVDGDDVVTDVHVIEEAIGDWQHALLATLGATSGWNDTADIQYATDKPDWDGYGSVVLLAAYDEHPALAPGAEGRRGFRRSTVRETAPRDFPEAAAYKEASRSPQRYPTLLGGAEWCLPLVGGPVLFEAEAPNGSELTMGRVDNLLAELTELNRATLRLSPADLVAASEAGPPAPNAPLAAAAPFGLALLLTLAEYASVHRVPWIMDY